MSENYELKLCVKIISENYDLVYQSRRNVRFIGILAYPKINNKHTLNLIEV